jgi:hypothetical protein
VIEWFRIFLSRFIGLFRNKPLDRELDAELNFHLDMLIQDNLKKGMSREEAKNAALRDFGGFDQTKEKYRDGRRPIRKISAIFWEASLQLLIVRLM